MLASTDNYSSQNSAGSSQSENPFDFSDFFVEELPPEEDLFEAENAAPSLGAVAQLSEPSSASLRESLSEPLSQSSSQSSSQSLSQSLSQQPTAQRSPASSTPKSNEQSTLEDSFKQSIEQYDVVLGIDEVSIEAGTLEEFELELTQENHNEDFRLLIETIAGEEKALESASIEAEFDTLVALFDEVAATSSINEQKPADEFAAIDKFINRPLTTTILKDDPGFTASGIPEDEIAALEALLDAPPVGMPELPAAAIPIAKPKAIEKPKEIESDRSSSEKKSDGDSKSTSSYTGNTIRVDLDRLEKLNNLVGELVTQDNTTILQVQQLQSAVNSIQYRFELFEKLMRELQDLSDRSQKDRAKLHQTTERYTGSVQADFDPLLMDSYGGFYTLAQSAIEEIVRQGATIREVVSISQSVQQTYQQKQQTLKDVRSDLMWIRMVPIGDILQRFPRMVRDMCVRYGKQVSVKLVGTDTLVDKQLLEKLLDPMVHLVRNAFDHGIEMPELRAENQKPTQAKIEIHAYHRGNQTYIEVKDDGRGIDVDRIRQKVVSLGWLSEAEAAKLPEHRVYEYMFYHGFSTAAQVTEVSGRGVGLDVVKEQVKSLKGTVHITSAPGQGTTFTLRFPLTMTVADLLVFRIQNLRMAIAVDALVGIVSADADQVEMLMGQNFYHQHGQYIPLYPQETLLQHYPQLSAACEVLSGMPVSEDGKISLLLIAGTTGTLALRVDQILQQQELAVKPFGLAIEPPEYLQGCTILADGSIAPVLNGHALQVENRLEVKPTEIREPEEPGLPEPGLEPEPEPEAIAPAKNSTVQTQEVAIEQAISTLVEPAKRDSVDFTQPFEPRTVMPNSQTILVVDDSMVVRQALVFTLEQAGYRVLQARDGQDAIAQLRRDPYIQGIFCDIEMPRMNGFEFLAACRENFPDSCPPVIMLTSRSSDKHREMARELGAKDYLTKPYLETVLLSTLRQYLE